MLGTYGYGISPSSSRAAIATADSFQHAGGKVGVLDTTVPFGSVDFTAAALVGQAGGHQRHGARDGLQLELRPGHGARAGRGEAQGDALRHRLRARRDQLAGLGRPAGRLLLSLFRPWLLPNAGTEQMQAAMEKYAHFTKSDFPTFGQYEAWAGADLMIKGLELAGPNPTRAAVIKDLRGLKSYNANGLLPNRSTTPRSSGTTRPQTVRLGDGGGEDRLHSRLGEAVLRHRHPGDLDGQCLVAGNGATRGPLGATT